MTVVHPGIIVASAMANPNPPSADDAPPGGSGSPQDCPEAALAAHDLNNLLAGVVGQAEVQRHLAMSAKPDQPFDMGQLQRSLESIMQSAAHAQVLCREMLALADGQPPHRIPIPVDAMVGHVVDLFTAFPQNLSIRVEGAEGLVVHGQRLDLERTLLNLLWNAREAVLGQDDACLEITWGADSAGPWVRVTDNGPGLPEQSLGDLTEPFRSHKESHGRLRGLGLHLVARVMRRHGGRLLARNRSDGPSGASFTLQFGFAPELDFDTPTGSFKPPSSEPADR